MDNRPVSFIDYSTSAKYHRGSPSLGSGVCDGDVLCCVSQMNGNHISSQRMYFCYPGVGTNEIHIVYADDHSTSAKC